MPKYVLSRDYTLRTLNGVISFEKDKPTWVTPVMEKDALHIGAERVDGEAPALLEDEKPPVKAPEGNDRLAQIYAAFEMIIEKNDAKEFTGQGVPTSKAVEKLVGFDVEKGEVIDAWAAYKVAKGDQ